MANETDERKKASPKGTKGKEGGARRDRNTRNTSQQRPETFEYLEVAMVLHHGNVMNAFNRSYDRFRTAYYHIRATLQRHRLEDSIQLVLNYLEEQVSTAEEQLSAAKESLRIRVDDYPGADSDEAVSVRRPREYQVTAKVPAGIARRYLRLYEALDAYTQLVIYAEITGVITHTEKRRLTQNSPKHVTAISGRLVSLSSAIGKRAQGDVAELAEAVRGLLQQHTTIPEVASKRPLDTGASAASAAHPVVSDGSTSGTKEASASQIDSQTGRPANGAAGPPESTSGTPAQVAT